MPEESPELTKTAAEETDPSPLRCWTGTTVAGSMSFAAYLISQNIAANFASKPPTGNTLALQIGVTVRTLVLGISMMATGIFAIIALGLFLLGWRSILSPSAPTNEES